MDQLHLSQYWFALPYVYSSDWSVRFPFTTVCDSVSFITHAFRIIHYWILFVYLRFFFFQGFSLSVIFSKYIVNMTQRTFFLFWSNKTIINISSSSSSSSSSSKSSSSSGLQIALMPVSCWQGCNTCFECNMVSGKPFCNRVHS